MERLGADTSVSIVHGQCYQTGLVCNQLITLQTCKVSAFGNGDGCGDLFSLRICEDHAYRVTRIDLLCIYFDGCTFLGFIYTDPHRAGQAVERGHSNQVFTYSTGMEMRCITGKIVKVGIRIGA